MWLAVPTPLNTARPSWSAALATTNFPYRMSRIWFLGRNYLAEFNEQCEAWIESTQLKMHKWSMELGTTATPNNTFINFQTPAVPGLVVFRHSLVPDRGDLKRFNQKHASYSLFDFASGRLGFKGEQKHTPLARSNTLRAAAWFAKRLRVFVRAGVRLRFRWLFKMIRLQREYRRFCMGNLRLRIHSLRDVSRLLWGGTRPKAHGRKRLRYHPHRYRFFRRRMLQQGNTYYFRNKRRLPGGGRRHQPPVRGEVGLNHTRPLRYLKSQLRDPKTLPPYLLRWAPKPKTCRKVRHYGQQLLQQGLNFLTRAAHFLTLGPHHARTFLRRYRFKLKQRYRNFVAIFASIYWATELAKGQHGLRRAEQQETKATRQWAQKKRAYAKAARARRKAERHFRNVLGRRRVMPDAIVRLKIKRAQAEAAFKTALVRVRITQRNCGVTRARWHRARRAVRWVKKALVKLYTYTQSRHILPWAPALPLNLLRRSIRRLAVAPASRRDVTAALPRVQLHAALTALPLPLPAEAQPPQRRRQPSVHLKAKVRSVVKTPAVAVKAASGGQKTQAVKPKAATGAQSPTARKKITGSAVTLKAQLPLVLKGPSLVETLNGTTLTVLEQVEALAPYSMRSATWAQYLDIPVMRHWSLAPAATAAPGAFAGLTVRAFTTEAAETVSPGTENNDAQTPDCFLDLLLMAEERPVLTGPSKLSHRQQLKLQYRSALRLPADEPIDKAEFDRYYQLNQESSGAASEFLAELVAQRPFKLRYNRIRGLPDVTSITDWREFDAYYHAAPGARDRALIEIGLQWKYKKAFNEALGLPAVTPLKERDTDFAQYYAQASDSPKAGERLLAAIVKQRRSSAPTQDTTSTRAPSPTPVKSPSAPSTASSARLAHPKSSTPAKPQTPGQSPRGVKPGTASALTPTQKGYAQFKKYKGLAPAYQLTRPIKQKLYQLMRTIPKGEVPTKAWDQIVVAVPKAEPVDATPAAQPSAPTVPSATLPVSPTPVTPTPPSVASFLPEVDPAVARAFFPKRFPRVAAVTPPGSFPRLKSSHTPRSGLDRTKPSTEPKGKPHPTQPQSSQRSYVTLQGGYHHSIVGQVGVPSTPVTGVWLPWKFAFIDIYVPPSVAALLLGALLAQLWITYHAWERLDVAYRLVFTRRRRFTYSTRSVVLGLVAITFLNWLLYRHLFVHGIFALLPEAGKYYNGWTANRTEFTDIVLQTNWFTARYDLWQLDHLSVWLKGPLWDARYANLRFLVNGYPSPLDFPTPVAWDMQRGRHLGWATADADDAWHWGIFNIDPVDTKFWDKDKDKEPVDLSFEAIVPEEEEADTLVDTLYSDEFDKAQAIQMYTVFQRLSWRSKLYKWWHNVPLHRRPCVAALTPGTSPVPSIPDEEWMKIKLRKRSAIALAHNVLWEPVWPDPQDDDWTEALTEVVWQQEADEQVAQLQGWHPLQSARLADVSMEEAFAYYFYPPSDPHWDTVCKELATFKKKFLAPLYEDNKPRLRQTDLPPTVAGLWKVLYSIVEERAELDTWVTELRTPVPPSPAAGTLVDQLYLKYSLTDFTAYPHLPRYLYAPTLPESMARLLQRAVDEHRDLTQLRLDLNHLATYANQRAYWHHGLLPGGVRLNNSHNSYHPQAWADLKVPDFTVK
jgi:hypothetical protein